MILKSKHYLWGSIFIVAVIVVGFLQTYLVEQYVKESLPSPKPAAEFTSPVLVEPPAGNSTSQISVDVNLDVPFAPQAPHGNWDQPYQDACEEATVIMVERYLRGASLSLEQMDAEILKLVDFQNKNYGFFKDSNIAETVRMTEAFYPKLKATAVYDVTESNIRDALAKGVPVVVLVNGQRLANPFYTAPGPERHTLVIKGVTGDKFITNDPGTRRGADFVYDISRVMNAMEDYDGDTPGTYKKAMILISD